MPSHNYFHYSMPFEVPADINKVSFPNIIASLSVRDIVHILNRVENQIDSTNIVFDSFYEYILWEKYSMNNDLVAFIECLNINLNNFIHVPR